MKINNKNKTKSNDFFFSNKATVAKTWSIYAGDEEGKERKSYFR